MLKSHLTKTLGDKGASLLVDSLSSAVMASNGDQTNPKSVDQAQDENSVENGRHGNSNSYPPLKLYVHNIKNEKNTPKLCANYDFKSFL